MFIDGQNLYHRCKDLFGHPWVHPRRLADALVAQDRRKYDDTHVLTGIRHYTGIHDPNRKPRAHARMARRLSAYRGHGILTFPIPLKYDAVGRAREKGVDVRMALDLVRLGNKGLYDVAIIVSGDADLDPAAQDIYALRDDERWIGVENALPWSPTSHTRWLVSVRRRRVIDERLFNQVKDNEHC